ncbi:hypothetical protein [Granulibacter bethesdensis]|nr:hypothetical protein [Granulibacter bethesdensis]
MDGVNFFSQIFLVEFLRACFEGTLLRYKIHEIKQVLKDNKVAFCENMAHSIQRNDAEICYEIEKQRHSFINYQ